MCVIFISDSTAIYSRTKILNHLSSRLAESLLKKKRKKEKQCTEPTREFVGSPKFPTTNRLRRPASTRAQGRGYAPRSGGIIYRARPTKRNECSPIGKRLRTSLNLTVRGQIFTLPIRVSVKITRELAASATYERT